MAPAAAADASSIALTAGTPSTGDATPPAPQVPHISQPPQTPPSGRPPELPAAIFRACDIRGIAGEALTPEIVRWTGRAIGAEAHRRGVGTLVTGRDGRRSSPELLAALVTGLRESGCDVIDVGLVPTPVLYFAAMHFGAASGVMVTGSHNPSDYNGLKIMIAGDTLHGDAIQDLRRRIEGNDLPSGGGVPGPGALHSASAIGAYIRRVCEEIPPARPGEARKIAIDCGNGAAGAVAPALFTALGHDVVTLYCDIDGSFPNHHPDPGVPANLQDLIAAVRAHEADLGLAFDGDGDRLGVVDSEGNIIWPDRQMMLFARDVLSAHPGAEIVFDVKCSGLLAEEIGRHGGRPVMWKTGHSLIKTRLRRSGAPLAGEMSGHIFFADRWYGFDDALYAAARLVRILTGIGGSSAQVFARLPAAKSTPELRVAVDEGAQARLVESLLSGSDFAGARRTTIDGLRVDFADRWGLARASNTEPSLVLRFEGADDAALERIKGEFKRALHGIEPSLDLPF